MAFKGHDGKNFGNRQQRDTYDKAKKPAKQEAKPEPEGEPDGDEGQMSLDEHMAAHGPAEKVEISHSEGKHTKTSHHGGKKHVSHHESAEEAHMEGAKAAGVDMMQDQQQPQQPMQPMGGMSGGIPGM